VVGTRQKRESTGELIVERLLDEALSDLDAANSTAYLTPTLDFEPQATIMIDIPCFSRPIEQLNWQPGEGGGKLQVDVTTASMGCSYVLATYSPRPKRYHAF
jgi:hypothetical protein